MSEKRRKVNPSLLLNGGAGMRMPPVTPDATGDRGLRAAPPVTTGAPPRLPGSGLPTAGSTPAGQKPAAADTRRSPASVLGGHTPSISSAPAPTLPPVTPPPAPTRPAVSTPAPVSPVRVPSTPAPTLVETPPAPAARPTRPAPEEVLDVLMEEEDVPMFGFAPEPVTSPAPVTRTPSTSQPAEPAEPGMVDLDAIPARKRSVNPLFADPEPAGKRKPAVNPLFADPTPEPAPTPTVAATPTPADAGGLPTTPPASAGGLSTAPPTSPTVNVPPRPRGPVNPLFKATGEGPVTVDGDDLADVEALTGKKSTLPPSRRKMAASMDSGDFDGSERSEASVDAKDGRRKAKSGGASLRITERDIVIIKFLARYRYAYVDQLARLVDSSVSSLQGRLAKLESKGLVRREKVASNQHLWVARKAGMVLVDVNYPEVKKGEISFMHVAHTIGLVNLGVEFEREAGGVDLLGEGKGNPLWMPSMNRWRLGIPGHVDGKHMGEMTVSEREIRQAQLRWRGGRSSLEMRQLVQEAVDSGEPVELEEGNEGLFVVYGAGGKGGEHIPDLVITRGRDENGKPEHIAVELELNAKPVEDWRRILRAYRDDGGMYAKVYYFTHKPEIGNALRRVAATEPGLADKLVVRRYIPKNGNLPFWG